MKAQPLAEKWREEIASGNRLVFVYKINGEFIGEGALVLNQNGLIYTDSNIENLLFTRFIMIVICRNAIAFRKSRFYRLLAKLF